MKVWRDYRVTIPAKIRRELGLHPGTEVEFIDLGDRIGIVKATVEPQKSTAKRTSEISREKPSQK